MSGRGQTYGVRSKVFWLLRGAWRGVPVGRSVAPRMTPGAGRLLIVMVGLLVAAAVATTGCGAASPHPSDTATTGNRATETRPSTSSIGAHRPSVVHRPARLAVPSGGGVSRHFVRATGERRVLLSLSSACAFARHGAPAAPLLSARTAVWRHYAGVARPFALRTVASLGRIPSGSHRLPALQRLITDYGRLAQLYASGDLASFARSVALSEQQTAADALAARVPVCAPFAPTPANGSEG